MQYVLENIRRIFRPSLEKLAPLYDDLAGGGCHQMDVNYLRWLAISAYNQSPIPVDERQILYGESNKPKKVIARTIQKQLSGTTKSHLVLSCPKRPEVEGLVLNRHTNLTCRPFYKYANYSVKAIHVSFQTALAADLEKVNLTPPPSTDASALLLMLLSMNNLAVGTHFAANLELYGDLMSKNSLVRNGWSDSTAY